MGILCFATVGRYWLPERPLLSIDRQQRKNLLSIARQQIGVREKSGHNDGEKVESYLASVGLKKGQPWCAAFISWVFKQGGYTKPCTAWSPALFNPIVKTHLVKPANVFGIWFPKLKRVGHVGLVERQEGSWIISIEGNTNIAGSREGDGVYRRRRLAKNIYVYADWVKGEEDKR